MTKYLTQGTASITLFLLIVFKLVSLNSLTTTPSELKLKNLNSVSFQKLHSIFFTSYIEKDGEREFIWLSEGSEVILVHNEHLNEPFSLDLNFDFTPCKRFIPLRLNFNNEIFIITNPGKFELDLGNNLINSFSITPLVDSPPCYVEGDSRRFFGRIFI